MGAFDSYRLRRKHNGCSGQSQTAEEAQWVQLTSTDCGGSNGCSGQPQTAGEAQWVQLTATDCGEAQWVQLTATDYKLQGRQNGCPTAGRHVVL